MPRKERSVRGRSIVAAAKNYTTGRSAEKIADTRGRHTEEWQSAAWDFFDMIPEYHQGCAIIGALLSRASLYVAERQPDGSWAPTTNPTAIAALDELYGGAEGQTEMLRQFGIHFSVAGEGWLIGPSGEDVYDPDKWLVAAATEVSKAGPSWKVNGDEVEQGSLVIRIWKRHPRKPKKADAPSRAILPVLSELLQLTKRVAAQIDSRLTGAGILFVPSETSFPSLPVRSVNPGDPEPTVTDSIQGEDAQGLADLLVQQAELVIQNPEHPASMIPIVASTPGEYIDSVQLINFWSELDKAAPRLREESIRRIALGMDVPPEVLLGSAGSNHWNMWLSDENSVKIHAEPLLKILTTSLSTGYLRPAIDGEVDDARDFAIMADTSQMRLRPNRSKEALELNDRLIMSDLAALRENGFTEADLMGEEELEQALLRKVASGSTTPELVAIALRQLGVTVPEITDNREPAEARPTRSLREHPTREIPERSAADLSALTFVAEQMVDRALQRAGNRIKTKFSLRNAPVPANRLYTAVELSAADVDDVLQDAWGACQEFDYGVDAQSLERALDLYTRSLLQSRREPSRAGIAASLKLILKGAAA